MRPAHHVAYELYVGPIPPGKQLDHTCRVRCCVRPSHLEPVTQKENIRRGVLLRPTVCRNGHPRTPDNTEWRPGVNGPLCKVCKAARNRRWYANKKGVAA
ncbi:MAG: HNH endonuclease signature motif containing protein [Candidatus Methylomirabilales bacterium]